MAPHSSTLAWKIPWTEEPGRLQSMESLRVGHDWATSLSRSTFMHWRRKWQPTPVFLPGESQGWGSLWAAVFGVAQSRTRLKRLSSSSSSLETNLDYLTHFINLGNSVFRVFDCIFKKFSWPFCIACGFLVPWPGIKPVPPALEAWSLNHWTAGKS